jgi:citrate synthase
MAILTGVVGALSAFDDVKQEKNHYDPTEVEITKIKIIAKMPTIAAISFRTAMGLPIVYPKKEYSYIENFLYMLFSNPME